MARQSLSAPIARRIFDRLERYANAGVFLVNVSKVSLGIPPKSVPMDALAEPIVLWCACYPTRAAGGAPANQPTSTTVCALTCEITVFGSTVGGSHEDFYQFTDTIDDLVKIICEIEQQAAWGRLDSTVVDGETIYPLANEEVDISYPALSNDDKTVFYHMAVLTWNVPTRITWA